MQVIAHRGNNKEALENSFTAYDLAVDCGAVRIELDVQMTRDGHPVINHDDHLGHTTGQNLSCSQLDRADFHRVQLLNGESVPFLDQVLERYLPKIELNIEIKGNRRDSAEAVVRLLKQNHYRERVIVSSFCPEPLLCMMEKASDIKRACLVGDDELPWPFFSHMAPLNFMTMVNASILHPRFTQVSESMMDQARARRWKVYTWATMVGEDSSKEAHWVYLKSLGVDGHCTNYPREMILWLQESESYERKFNNLVTSTQYSYTP